MWTLRPDDSQCADESQVGGKACNLAMLQRNESVPHFFVVTTEAYTSFIHHCELEQDVWHLFDSLPIIDGNTLDAKGAAIRDSILSGQMPDEIASNIVDAFALLQKTDPGAVSVRSSAVGEDAVGSSFAGQFDSFLYVTGETAVLTAVQACWASGFSNRILRYRQHKKKPGMPAPIAVVVQHMLDPQAAGVLFTADPTDGNRKCAVISAAFGCGEGVVQGELDCDFFKVQDGAFVLREVKHKKRLVASDPAGGTRFCDVPKDQRDQPSISDDMALNLATIGRTIADRRECPQDIEWAVEQGKLYLLQTRPITHLPPDPAKQRKRLWDNSNIVESYPGVTTPLTFSFARRAYTVVYEQFCQVMGVSQQSIEENRNIFGHMLGLYRGRIYYDLQNWYQLISMLPAYQTNRVFMEQMMGVSEAADLAEPASPISVWRKVRFEWPRTLQMITRLLARLATIEKQVAHFNKRFENHYAKVSQQTIENLELDELQDLIRQLENNVLGHWRAPIVTDFFAMVFYGLLKRMCTSWLEDDDTSLQNKLLSGIGGLESAEPAYVLIKLAKRIRDSKHLASCFQACSDEEAYAKTRPGGELAAIGPDIDRYLKRYGDRCMEELKLETVSLRDDPSFIFTSLRGFVQRPDMDSTQLEQRERLARKNTETGIYEHIGRHSAKGLAFDVVLQQTRRHIRNRELLRLSRSKIFGVARRIFLSAGQRLVEQNVLRSARDVLYLHVDEILDFIEGTAVSQQLQGLADLRRAEFAAYRQEVSPPARFVSSGPPPLFVADSDNQGAVENGMLSGIGACPGVVEGRARVVENPKDVTMLDGEILVAERTDPGWVPLFVSCRGLLVERGSLLSHSAIVAREFGIPTVVGIQGLLKHVATGDMLKLDGGKGTVGLPEQTEESQT